MMVSITALFFFLAKRGQVTHDDDVDGGGGDGAGAGEDSVLTAEEDPDALLLPWPWVVPPSMATDTAARITTIVEGMYSWSERFLVRAREESKILKKLCRGESGGIDDG